MYVGHRASAERTQPYILSTRNPTQSTLIISEFINKNKKDADGGKRPILRGPSRKMNLVRNFQICKKGLLELDTWHLGAPEPESGSGSEAPRLSIRLYQDYGYGWEGAR